MEDKPARRLEEGDIKLMEAMGRDYKQILVDVLDSAKASDYAGYGKFDALNSPLLYFLSFNNAWLRFFWIQAVKQSPFHVRPLLGVKKSRNPKGIALFSRAYLFLHQATGKKEYLDEAISLIQWLLDNPSLGKEHLCWGYNFIWQDIPPFLQDKNEPNIVVTSFVGEALVQLYRVTKEEKYLQALLSIASFITRDLSVLYESGEERAISYILGKVDSVVLNVQLMSASLLIKIWKHTSEKRLFEIARKQMNYTINKRTEYCAWYYTHPSSKSHIRHDNYHTGGVLDAIIEYIEESGNDEFSDIYWKGLDYYQKSLFERDGAPRWMNDSKFPHDIHGSAQGIISFAKAGRYKKEYLQQARLIADWSLANLYRPRERDFIYRKGRFMKWNYSLMRWCNAWMSRAFGELIG